MVGRRLEGTGLAEVGGAIDIQRLASGMRGHAARQ
jgi:hypothetical protein